ncbi:hypothetical protein ACMD2_15398 [Ananas comosus]|uniref:Uncharacterized protein n=1 Tax=Ananas comosus TaxID=4615 RepID=A0A199W5D8_ANACO|nr:hypothetical protein ACMD2_15398 [Ananas comosus]
MASMDGYPLALPSVPPRRRPPYVRRGSCLVVPPPSPARKPSAVVKFLGGAFVGASDWISCFSHFMELLAREGFLVVSVPYDVTFDHERAAKEVFERFHSCLDSLLDAGIPDAGLEPSDLSRLPIFSVGHSNGALLQLLVGSYFSEKIPKANAIISFNNKPAAEAVPYFEQVRFVGRKHLSSIASLRKHLLLGPMVSQVMPIMEVSPVYSMARNASDDAWKALLDTAGTLIQEYDQEIMVSLNKFADQIPSVMNQVTQGISEFRPTPSENRQLFKKSYSVPHTLLVKFSDDPIDETDLLEDILRPRVASIGGSIEKVTLSGTHLTPCAQDLQWQVGPQYTPADAVAQSLKSLSLNDTRVLARTIADWFKRINPE